MQNIMIALDYGEGQSEILTAGLKLASKFSSSVFLVHVAAPEPDFVGYEVGPQYIRDEVAKELRKEHRWLQKYKEQFQAMDVSTEALLIQGSTSEVLLEEIRKLNIDLLILGNRKHGFLHNLFLGSTKDKIIDENEVPILLVPIKEQT